MPNCSVVLPGSVWTLQRGLKVLSQEWSREHGSAASAFDPGGVDGRWGQRTRFAVDNAMRNMRCELSHMQSLRRTWDAAPARATQMMLPVVLTRMTDEASRRYVRPISEPELGPPSPTPLEPFEAGNMELDPIDVPFTPLNPAPPAPAPVQPRVPATSSALGPRPSPVATLPTFAPRAPATNWPLWITLGLGLTAAGGVIWFINKRSR